MLLRSEIQKCLNHEVLRLKLPLNTQLGNIHRGGFIQIHGLGGVALLYRMFSFLKGERMRSDIFHFYAL